MVGPGARDDVFFGWTAQHIVVVMDKAQRSLDRRGATRGQEHLVHGAGRYRCELARQARRWFGAQGKGVDIGQARGLLGNRLGHFRAAIADLGAPHARRAVDHARTFIVIDVNALAMAQGGAPGIA